MSKASIYFYPKVEKKNAKTGRIPIYARIIINRGKAETRLSCDVDESDLVLWDKEAMRFRNDKLIANKVIIKLRQAFDDLIYRKARDFDSMTAGFLMNELFGRTKTGETILGFVNGYYLQSILLNGSLSNGTKKNYKKSINHLENCLKYWGETKLPLSMADASFGNRFHDYLLASIPSIKKSAMEPSSAAGNVKKLKAIFQRGYEEGKLDRNPFATVKLKVQSRYREKLNSNELKALVTYNLDEFATLDKVRDIFLFSAFTGLAYQDAMDLKRSDIQKWEKGEYYIRLRRVKTDVETKLFLVSYAMYIIERYKSVPNEKNTVLPRISNQQLNMRLKVLADKVGVNKELTSHIARHTFRQMQSEAGITDLAAIKTMMGHSRRSDIDAIYHSVTEKQLFEAKQKYQSFLDELLNEYK